MRSFRQIPSVEAVLQREGLQDAIARHGHAAVAGAVRTAADTLRASIADARETFDTALTRDDAADRIENAALDLLAGRGTPSLQPVINATGVILHTNLGRAPLAAAALDRAAEVSRGYANLEYDLDAGRRGHRHVHAERLLCTLTGAEAALVTNNNAAATLLVLAALASGREVVASRGELVEIGGGFRIPDVMAQSGALLREVGTTNRTRVSDYAAAVGETTAMLLRVHSSNFRIEGFTEQPDLAALAALAARFKMPLFEDLGSGWLGLDDIDTPPSLADEPSIRGSLRAGVDLVGFSGDKLLGGPQAGIVVGRRPLIDRIRSHPLMRAVRADKVTYAALEATLALWLDPVRRYEVPALRMLTLTAETLVPRAAALAGRIDALAGASARVAEGVSTTGGGTAPGSALPTMLVTIRPSGISTAELERRLRRARPQPVVARIEDDQLAIDLRTVAEELDAALFDAIADALGVGVAAGGRPTG